MFLRSAFDLSFGGRDRIRNVSMKSSIGNDGDGLCQGTYFPSREEKNLFSNCAMSIRVDCGSSHPVGVEAITISANCPNGWRRVLLIVILSKFRCGGKLGKAVPRLGLIDGAARDTLRYKCLAPDSVVGVQESSHAFGKSRYAIGSMRPNQA